MKESTESKSLWLSLELAERLHIEFNLVNTNNCKVCTKTKKAEGFAHLRCGDCRAIDSALLDLQECMSTLFATGLVGGES